MTQNCAERCWAASIAGIFGYNGHTVEQDAIAAAIFGTTACLPAGGSSVLNTVLDHEWVDDSGDRFTATITGLYDPAHGVTEMNNDDLVTQMENDSPVLYCNRSHAMVIVGLDYRRDQNGDLIAVDQVHVADPFPGMGFHVLSRVEMAPVGIGGELTYVASVSITDT